MSAIGTLASIPAPATLMYGRVQFRACVLITATADYFWKVCFHSGIWLRLLRDSRHSGEVPTESGADLGELNSPLSLLVLKCSARWDTTATQVCTALAPFTHTTHTHTTSLTHSLTHSRHQHAPSAIRGTAVSTSPPSARRRTLSTRRMVHCSSLWVWIRFTRSTPAPSPRVCVRLSSFSRWRQCCSERALYTAL